MNQERKSPTGEVQPLITEIMAFSDFAATKRWVRGLRGGETLVDSKRAMILWRKNELIPIYCFPKDDVRMTGMAASSHTEVADELGDVVYWDLEVDGDVSKDAAWAYPNPPARWPDLKDYVALRWDAMDAWYEEDEQVHVHVRDPYHRIDVLSSARHVKVMVGGEVVADSHRPRLLFETGFPTRYYLPREDVRMDLLAPSARASHCPYKGVASYWSVEVGDKVFEDVVWGYSDPIEECPKIKGLLCFFNEHVDAIEIDGTRELRPLTRWST